MRSAGQKASRNRPRGSSENYILDQLLLPRLKHFALNNNISDVDACVDYLRRNYREYARKQQGPFRKLVLRAVQILKQKQQRKLARSPSHRESKLHNLEEEHAQRHVSPDSSGASSDEAHEESFVSGVGEPLGDEDELQSKKVKKKRKLEGSSSGFASDSTDEDDVIRPSPGFNILNSYLRKAYDHARHDGERPEVDNGEKPPNELEEKTLIHSLHKSEADHVQAFASPDIIAAAAKRAAAKTIKKITKQAEGSITSTEACTAVEEPALLDMSLKPEVLSGSTDGNERQDIGKMAGRSEKATDSAGQRSQRPEKGVLRKKTTVSESKERELANSSMAEAIRFSDLGGIDNVLDLIREITFPLYNPGIYSWLGLQPIGGVLLHGPPGCGKTKLANAIAYETGLPFLKISGPEVVSGMSGESEAKLRGLFTEAARLAPCIVFIDEIDSITSKRENAQREMERRIVTQLMTCMDELSHSFHRHDDEKDGSVSNLTNRKHVLVIGATNRPEVLDPALRRPGRFDREILLGVPDENGRAKILTVLAKHLRLEGSFDFKHIARCTPGFVAADLAALTREAGSVAIKRIMASKAVDHVSIATDGGAMEGSLAEPGLDATESSESASLRPVNLWKAQWTHEDMHALSITMQDFEEAVAVVQPSTKREGFSAIPNVKWEDVGALSSVQRSMEFFISRRIKHPEDYEVLGLDMDTGFLLYGPPGCGKTLVAKAVANDAQANFIYVKGPELLNKYVGESEHAVRALFSRARSCAPCIIFFDEMDALAPRRGTDGNAVAERVLNQLLTEMDGADKRKGVFLIGATNRPDMIDPAVLRPGRLGKLLYIPLPDAEGRLSILKTLTRRKPISSDVDLATIVASKRCEGLSGADLAALVNEACIVSLQERCFTPTSEGGRLQQPLIVNSRHFDMALSQVSPSVSKQDMLYYKDLPKKFNCVSGNGIAAEAYP